MMKKISPKPLAVVTVALLALLSAADAHAYVDPGTAGYLYQIIFIIFSGVVGIFVFFKQQALRFLGAIGRIFKGGQGPKK